MINHYKYVYGPVHSWRLGVSLGVDPLSSDCKVCNMDCTYCQLGKTVSFTEERKNYVPADALVKEVESIPNFFIDYITFSGRGEPTLAKNLGELIKAVKSIRREKVAVITNSLLMARQDVREDLMLADFVLAKLDAPNQQMLNDINGASYADFDLLIKSIGEFRWAFKGKFALQMMLIKDNFDYVKQLANMAFFINPDEVQLNTPLRSCGQRPLGRDRLEQAKELFKGVPVISCYDTPTQHVPVLDEQATLERHGAVRKNRYVY